MDFQIIFSPLAIQDLREIVAFIARDDEGKAAKFGHALMDEAETLRTLPNRGRFVPELDDGVTREIIYGQYRIVYRVDATKRHVTISRFWHGARLMEP